MARKNRSPEENARREKIRELLQMANIGSMDDIQNLFKETIAEFMCKNRHPSPICTRFEHHLAGGLAPLSRTEAPLALSHFWASLPVRCRNRTLSDMCTEF